MLYCFEFPVVAVLVVSVDVVLVDLEVDAVAVASVVPDIAFP